jgi:hypothetical protein
MLMQYILCLVGMQVVHGKIPTCLCQLTGESTPQSSASTVSAWLHSRVHHVC